MMDAADVKEGGGGIAGPPDGSSDPKADNAEAADSLLQIARDKDSASREILGTDKFTANAKTQPWAPDGFDQLTGAKRTTDSPAGNGVSTPKKAGVRY